MEFLVLGDLIVRDELCDVTPSAPKVRQLLALLILRPNQSVPIDAVIDELWGDRPPNRAVRTVRTYIYELRRCLPSAIAQMLATGLNGYIARLPPDLLDLHRFESLVAQGREALTWNDPARAQERLGRALSLWRGRVLANVDHGELISAHATRLEELRLRSAELRVDASFQLNHHREVVAELKGLTASNRLHEGLHQRLMSALHRAGRRGEALEVFRDLRRRFIDELGLEPGPELQQLHRMILEADAEPDVAAPSPPPVDGPRATVSVSALPGGNAVPMAARPAQLPPDCVDFTGRTLVVRRLTELLASGRSRSGVPIIGITGMAGVGKTTTAIHFAHQVRRQFPDGQLYIDLKSSSDRPVPVGEALSKVLRAVGVHACDVPGSPDERMMMLRSWSFDQRLLVVIDDVSSATQIEPLLPGGDGCAVVVTGRTLHGLRGMKGVHLSVFDHAEAAEYLAGLVGHDKVQAEQEAAAQLVCMVGGLPLALNFVGGRLNAVPSMSLAEFNSRVCAARDRKVGLSRLSSLGFDLYERFDASYRQLSEEDQAAFLRVGLTSPQTFTAAELASVLSVSEPAAGMLLMRLVDAQLVEPRDEADGWRSVYRIHELVRLYAMERLTTVTALTGS